MKPLTTIRDVRDPSETPDEKTAAISELNSWIDSLDPSKKGNINPATPQGAMMVEQMARSIMAGYVDEERARKLIQMNPRTAPFLSQAIDVQRQSKAQETTAQSIRDRFIRPESSFSENDVGKGMGMYEIGARVPGVSNPKGYRDALVNMGLDKQAKSVSEIYKLGESPFAKIGPKDYTRESVKTFEETGKHSDLIPTTKLDPEKAAELSQKIRKEFNSLAGPFIDVRDSYARINETSKAVTAAGDLALIFNFMKMLDPQSVVRETEFRSAEQARSWLSRADSEGIAVPSFVRTAIQKADPSMSGPFLLPEQRKDFTTRAKSLYDRQEASHRQLEREYTGIANRAKLDPRDVVPDFRYQESKTINGKRYYKKGNDWFEEPQ